MDGAVRAQQTYCLGCGAAIPFRAITSDGSVASLLTDTLALGACFSGTKLWGATGRTEGAGKGDMHEDDANMAASWTCEVFVSAATQLRRSSRLKSVSNDIAAGHARCFPLSKAPPGGNPAWTRMLVEKIVPHVAVGTPAQTLCVWDQGAGQAKLLRFLLRKAASARVHCTTTAGHDTHLTLTPLTERCVSLRKYSDTLQLASLLDEGKTILYACMYVCAVAMQHGHADGGKSARAAIKVSPGGGA